MLRSTGEIPSRCFMRKGDFVARYGGEEFAVVLRDIDVATARIVADRGLYEAKDQGRDRVVVAEGTLKKDRVLAPEAEITPVAPASDRKTLE